MRNSEQDRRAAAETVMRSWAKPNGCEPVWAERVEADRVVFTGTAPDGREYAIGYLKDAA
jgi:hypothetical protein